jgi:hypothetical protein
MFVRPPQNVAAHGRQDGCQNTRGKELAERVTRMRTKAGSGHDDYRRKDQDLSRHNREQQDLERLIADKGLKRYGLFLVSGEGRRLPDGSEETSRYVVNQDRRVTTSGLHGTLSAAGRPSPNGKKSSPNRIGPTTASTTRHLLLQVPPTHQSSEGGVKPFGMGEPVLSIPLSS